METLRTFIAVDFPIEIKAKIEEITTYFNTQLPSKVIKWVDANNIHLTLKFMGETPANQLEPIKRAMQQVVTTFPIFDVAIENLGMYPNAKKPRVIWLGISCEENLISLYKKLDQALKEIGIQPERRPFSPHLTVGRVRRSADPESVIIVGKTLSEFKVSTLGRVTINEVVYYQSELTPQGPNYTILQSTPLNQV